MHGAQAEGKLRDDVDTDDIALLLAMRLRRPRATSPELARMANDRCGAIMVDGLKAKPDEPLPGRPLTRNDLNH